MNVLFQRIEDFITAAGLHTGYAFKFYRFTDADTAGKNPLIVLRSDGAGPSNSLVQSTDVLLQLIQVPTAIKAGDDRMHQLLQLFRGTTTVAGVLRFDPLGAVRGPFFLENKRPVFELSVRCITEDS